ncbi:hypothetical protein CABS01_13860 [Colletotrichum abscissum]|uniref:Uncharacterized protein n=1 Tax=Colletotrichum abscissum TaxID=1671311 RepID=A0A9Q0B801_9PEZI|nr:uncharacterized protein CABS01_13860 [Colletotrichum abscissum]KAI3558755.1 hypothetical protein CABS02_00795 [Colletotrichum abscissum]KAK1484437.1 hypothetical protein CABS01_13860 [Colletotrichum abscissum]
MRAEAMGLRQQPSTFKMNDLVSLPPGIKSEDIPIPSRESSREFSLPFRPSPADLLFPSPPALRIEPTDMPSCVCYRVEHLFSIVFGVLYANKDTVMDWRQYWNKVQRLLSKENPLRKTEVTAHKI